MGIGRSTFYDIPDARARDLTIVAEMKTICDEFEAYGYRRVATPSWHCREWQEDPPADARAYAESKAAEAFYRDHG